MRVVVARCQKCVFLYKHFYMKRRCAKTFAETCSWHVTQRANSRIKTAGCGFAPQLPIRKAAWDSLGSLTIEVASVSGSAPQSPPPQFQPQTYLSRPQVSVPRPEQTNFRPQANWLNRFSHSAGPDKIRYDAIKCNTMQRNAIQCNTMQYNEIPCNTHTIPCNTHAMQCNAIQYKSNTIQ